MFEPPDELLQKAVDAANKKRGFAPAEDDLAVAREVLAEASIGKSHEETLRSWSWFIVGYIAAHEDMAKE